jgi:undecaprenyl-diphosphatase
MHHLLDIVVGAVNGVVCALLAWHYLRRRTARQRASGSMREAVSR